MTINNTIILTKEEKEAIKTVCEICDKIYNISPNEFELQINGYTYLSTDFHNTKLRIESLIDNDIKLIFE